MERRRTLDVTAGADSFEELLLPKWLIDGLNDAGFVKPSPVQTTAIPMGRLGADLIVQAKAGTGKTLVLGIICLDKLLRDIHTPQVLILAPTHEIALQSAEVLAQLAVHMPDPGLAIGTFIGGLPITEDQRLLRRRCHVAVGTPGRVCKLLEMGALVVRNCRTLVLDEADHLLSDSFVKDIRRVVKSVLPARKQVVALSATYSEALLAELEGLMTQPHHVMLCRDSVSLLGVKQFYQELPAEFLGAGEAGEEGLLEAKVHALLRLLRSTTFNQAVIFLNAAEVAEDLTDRLVAEEYPSAFISGAQAQVDRMDTIAAVHDFRVRVVVATDVAARGLDLSAVNLVVNLDLPYDAATYMHRVGRTGRFGTHGVAVTLASSAELIRLHEFIADAAGSQIEPLPEHIPEELYHSSPFPQSGPTPGPWQPTEAPHHKAPPHTDTPEDSAHQSAASAPSAEVVWQRQQGHDTEGVDEDEADDEDQYDHDDFEEHDDCDDLGDHDAFDEYDEFDDDDVSHCDELEAAISSVHHEGSVPGDVGGGRLGSSAAPTPMASSGAGASSSVCSAAQPTGTDTQQAAEPHATGFQALGGIMGVSLWHRALRDETEPQNMPPQPPTPPPQPLLPQKQQPCQPTSVHQSPAAHTSGSCLDVSDQQKVQYATRADAAPGSGEADANVAVSKELLLRYYQLEAFAAEYYAWFINNANPERAPSIQSEFDQVRL